MPDAEMAGAEELSPVGYSVAGVFHDGCKVQSGVGACAQVEGCAPVPGSLVELSHLSAHSQADGRL